MSDEPLNAFLKAVTADAGLQEKINAAADADVVVQIAQEAGFAISVEAAEELQRAQAEVPEEALGEMAGGTAFKFGFEVGG